ncbi:TolC family protein [candidate division KSB1 bacterium]|nr:TolC family protein [candidate division KSB1 bacterium]
MFSKFLCALLILIFAGTVTLPAQEEAPLQLLKLGDAIAIALEKSYEMKVARLDKLAAEKNLISAKSNFKMRADATFDLPDFSEDVQETYREGELPVYETRGDIRYQGNLALTQPLPTDGNIRLLGRTYYGGVSYWDDRLQENITRNDVLTSLRLDLNQPLFTLNDLKTNLKRADLRFESAEQRYKREELDIVYNVTAAFFALHRATRELEIANDNVRQQGELAELAQQKYNAGLIPEVEALQLEVDLAQSRAAHVAAEAALARISDQFKQLIGLTFRENVGVMTSFEISRIEVELDQAVQLALESRAEIALEEIQVELAKLEVKQTDALRDFSGVLSAFYDITGVANSDVWSTSKPVDLWNKSLEDMEQRPKNRGIVFSLNVPIWDFGGNKAAVQSAEANLRTQELSLAEMRKTVEREVRDAVRRLRESQSQLEVLDKQEALAKRAYDISVERFNNGDITSQELALDRDRYIDAQVSYLGSYINYQLALADLKRKTMFDFEFGHSMVE